MHLGRPIDLKLRSTLSEFQRKTSMPFYETRSAASLRSVTAVVALFLCGCSALTPSAHQESGVSKSAKQPPRDLRISNVLATEGIKKLQENEYEDASRIFNAALKFSPDKSSLHFLNGLTYHLMYLRGDESMKELALTGYQLALSADPSFFPAALQLGRLEFEGKDFRKSVEAFQRAIEIEPQNGDAQLGMAAAAYYGHDLILARKSVEKAGFLLPGSATPLRAAAMIHAALGENDKAKVELANYVATEPDRAVSAHLTKRVEQWRFWHAALPKPGSDYALADTASPKSVAQSAAGEVKPNQPSAPLLDLGSTTPNADSTTAIWADCAAAASATSASADPVPGPTIPPAGGDETIALPALPLPCKGAGLPKMVILDVAIIRTENTATSSHGVNLLENLSYVFNRSVQLSDVLTKLSDGTSSRGVTVTRQRSNMLPAAGVSYSLNIANAADSRSEVLARPSLVALDRRPSTFFSGRNLTLGIAGEAGGVSAFTDKAIGVSLSVTPTFLGNDTMLVAVRAARSFTEEPSPSVKFGLAVQTSRNSVSANVVLKFGQTLILSGMAEQEVQRITSGVPVLKDIPVLQYLFADKDVQNFTRTVLILITPRQPASDQEVLSRNLSELERSGRLDEKSLIPTIQTELKKSPMAPPNLDKIYINQLQSGLLLQFRSNDIRANDWSASDRLGSFFEQLGGLMYF